MRKTNCPRCRNLKPASSFTMTLAQRAKKWCDECISGAEKCEKLKSASENYSKFDCTSDGRKQKPNKEACIVRDAIADKLEEMRLKKEFNY